MADRPPPSGDGLYPERPGPGARNASRSLSSSPTWSDSMNLTATMDLEDWGELMGRFFAILRDGVTRFDGHVDKFTGDGIMALFGAPIAYEDHARQACAAALHLREELAAYRRRTRAATAASASRCGSGSTRARSWPVRSTTTRPSNTRRWAPPSGWPSEWSRWPSRARSTSPPPPPRWWRDIRVA